MSSFAVRASLAVAAAAASLSAHAQWVGINNYVNVGSYALPTNSPNPFSATQFEASGVSWNRDTNTLFIVGDGGGYVMQTSLTGTPIDFMRLAAGSSPQGNEFYDPEGLAYIGNGQFVMTEERYRTAVRFTYAAGTTLQRSQTSTVKLATTVGNTGLEGLSTDPLTGGYIFVNQSAGNGGSLQNVFQSQISFAAGTATNGSATTVNNTALFPPANVGFANLNDVFALANIYGTSTAGHDNLLVMTTTGVREMTRAGAVVGSLAFPGPNAANPFEGITMDANGRIYVVTDNGDNGTNSSLLVYAPIPEPGTYAMLLAGLALIAGVARRRAA